MDISYPVASPPPAPATSGRMPETGGGWGERGGAREDVHRDVVTAREEERDCHPGDGPHTIALQGKK